MQINTETFQINNRRYLGNKYKLTDFIRSIIDSECGFYDSFADLFAGTGSVSSVFMDKQLITNDILYSNYLCHLTWFGNENYNQRKLQDLINYYNTVDINEDNYMSVNFADTYFSKSDCQRIGFIREDIENRFHEGELNEREKAILITSLLYAMDKIANTCGHYDAYFKNANFNKHLHLLFPKIESSSHKNQCYHEDANELVRHIKADVVYVDPPYNSRQYSSAYHLLENVACWDKKPVNGVALKMDMDDLKSDYCTNSAVTAFKDLVDNIDAKYIVLSYNNMATKGNSRSNARITDTQIMDILSTKGNTKVFSKPYKPFSAGKSSIVENEERIFLCKVFPAN